MERAGVVKRSGVVETAALVKRAYVVERAARNESARLAERAQRFSSLPGHPLECLRLGLEPLALPLLLGPPGAGQSGQARLKT
ncbi:hypothetical protein IMCC26207_108129 [Actinobacteria bacterium IMCC26207]|nr:hypothetical protein IMCC26207_108129 [Actinobacteria bacterium IMCC26207]